MSFFEDSTLKKVLYSFIAVLVIATIVMVSIYIYSDNLELEGEEYSLETKDYEYNNISKEVSSSQDKNISNVKTITSDNNVNSNTNSDTNITNTEKVNNKATNNSKTNTLQNNKQENENTEDLKKQDEKPVAKKELKFKAPVDGDIMRDFAKETLEYSKTLDEWTSHLGIDIRGAKTSIVKAAEDGVIESIKNDPRFGLTITINHQDGFKTVYSNLLTTDFVKEGDTVEKGDTIATIGETASFEILDEPHLHFEMYKDEEPVNPTIYLKE